MGKKKRKKKDGRREMARNGWCVARSREGESKVPTTTMKVWFWSKTVDGYKKMLWMDGGN